MLRYECELRWLRSHPGSVDRVLHSDVFDVFFQADPLAYAVDRSALTFVVEPHRIRSGGWNIAWVRRCYGYAGMVRLRHNFIVCSGSIGGPASDCAMLIRRTLAQSE
jgi:hypothetical protein